jgi:cyanophycin synthetase
MANGLARGVPIAPPGLLKRLRTKAGDVSGVLLRRRFRPLRGRFYRRMWDSVAREVGAEISAGPQGMLVLRRDGFAVFVRGSELMLDSALTERALGDKAASYAAFARLGEPVPDHVVCGAEDGEDARAFLAAHPEGVAVKPADGTGAGQGITVGVREPRDLDRAMRRAASFNPAILIEPVLPGASFRLLFLDGLFLEALRRDPPVVVGDGRSTLAALCRAETARRLAAQPAVALNPLEADLDAQLHLAAAGARLRDVPPAGAEVVVKRTVNQNAAAQNHVCRDVHPDVIARCGALVRAMNVRFAGVDIMAPALDRPLAETGGVIGEINVNPGLHHHVLTAGGDRRPSLPARLAERLFETRTGGMPL